MRFPTLSATAALALSLLLTGPDAGAQAFDDEQAGLADAAYLGITIPLSSVLQNVDPVENPAFTAGRLDRGAREALTWDDPGLADTLSDVTLVTLSTSALALPFLTDGGTSRREWAGAIVALEALSGSALVSGIAKHLTGRTRPAGDSFNSFFSGHASTAFAAATTLTIFAYEYDWLDDDTRWAVPATSYLVAGATAYLRVAGDRHWLTDVLVGGVVGTAVSYLTFSLRAGD